jgi:hypothetical protein
MSGMGRNFHHDLYSTEGTRGMAEFLNFVPISVRQTMNDILVAPFEESKVKVSLFQMYPLQTRMVILHNFSRNIGIFVVRLQM